jgi:hypothetical protein
MSNWDILAAVAPKVVAVIVPMLLAFVLLERFLEKRSGQTKDKDPKRD